MESQVSIKNDDIDIKIIIFDFFYENLVKIRLQVVKFCVYRNVQVQAP